MSSNGIVPDHESFAKFFQCWISEQYRDLESLLAAAAAPVPITPAAAADDEDHHLSRLVDRVIGHYEYYYRAKAASAKLDVLPMFSPKWTSSTENLFLWIGGWRPSTAFHVLYSKSGLQLEPRLQDLIRGVETRDLADLTPEQMNRIDQLQRTTIGLEKEISEEAAAAQEKVASWGMMQAMEAMREMGEGVRMMETEMEGRREAMEKVLGRADGLRMETIRGILGSLRPIQGVHFLIAAVELHLRVHEYGIRKDAAAAAAVPESNAN